LKEERLGKTTITRLPVQLQGSPQFNKPMIDTADYKVSIDETLANNCESCPKPLSQVQYPNVKVEAVATESQREKEPRSIAVLSNEPQLRHKQSEPPATW
jgi:hypothetical protein